MRDCEEGCFDSRCYVFALAVVALELLLLIHGYRLLADLMLSGERGDQLHVQYQKA